MHASSLSCRVSPTAARARSSKSGTMKSGSAWFLRYAPNANTCKRGRGRSQPDPRSRILCADSQFSGASMASRGMRDRMDGAVESWDKKSQGGGGDKTFRLLRCSFSRGGDAERHEHRLAHSSKSFPRHRRALSHIRFKVYQITLAFTLYEEGAVIFLCKILIFCN